MPNYKIQEYLNYAVMLAMLTLTMFVASAFAHFAKGAVIRIRLTSRTANHIASLRIEKPCFQPKLTGNALFPSRAA